MAGKITTQTVVFQFPFRPEVETADQRRYREQMEQELQRVFKEIDRRIKALETA
jgi:hypothetical protein